jgi:transposase-like protein
MGCEGEVIVEMTPTEAVSMLEKAWQENKRLRQENATLTEERDQARRMYCSTMADCLTVYCAPEDIATDRGWDCYKKDGK